jgi:4-amino-4-deoxy-L-arabinose transferase-like glycosyltransferase
MATSETSPPNAWRPTQRQLFSAFAIYFVIQVVSRTLLSPSTHLDESEQLVFTQQWAWGYGPQPPLYTWIQKIIFSAFGVSVFSLALFKNILLFLIYALAYWNARFITRSQACGAVAAVSVLFIPQISWESQRDITHSVLATVLSLVALGLFCRVVEFRKTFDYLALGICIGLGCLSKYNFVLFLAGLLLAALTLKNPRAAVLNWRMLLAAIIGGLILLPHGLWAVHHQQMATASSSKFAIQHSAPWLGSTVKGLKSLFLASIAFILPTIVIPTLIFLHAEKCPEEITVRCDFVRLAIRTLVIIMALVVLCVMFVHVTNFRGRWFQPVLIIVPVLIAALLRQQLEARRLKWLMRFSAFVAIALLIALPSRIVFGEKLHHEEPLHFPYAVLAAQMKNDLAPATVIVTDDSLLAGNLRLALQPRLVVTTEIMDEFAPDAQNLAFAWNPKKNEERPKALTDYAEQLGSVDWSQAKYVSADYYYFRNKQGTMGYILMDRSKNKNQ